MDFHSFSTKLDLLRQLNLPHDKYIVIGSGSMAVRGIRDTKDLDVVVTPDLWEDLAKKYNVVDREGILRIDLGADIEILGNKSIYTDSSVVPLSEMFESADVINGIRFIALDHLKSIKAVTAREKDLIDIILIEKYQNDIH